MSALGMAKHRIIILGSVHITLDLAGFRGNIQRFRHSYAIAADLTHIASEVDFGGVHILQQNFASVGALDHIFFLLLETPALTVPFLLFHAVRWPTKHYMRVNRNEQKWFTPSHTASE
jgi:hypothetical protein